MTIIDGKFELVRQIGEGGMGAVYEARNLRSGKRVALKQMTAAVAGSPEALQRFLREAQAATAIEHPGVVEVYDVGVADGAPYIVMEFMNGEPLSALMEREGKVAPRRFVSLLGRSLGALAAAHARGIIHRDLKPDNVFLARVPGTGEPAPKLLDFGISKVREENEGLGLTKTGTMLGTPYYMSREQAEGLKTIDERTDIYSLGVIFYQALSGQLPFNEPSLPALMAAIFIKDPTPLSLVAADVSPAVSAVVMRAMAKMAPDRFPSVDAFVRALAEALGDPSVIAEAALPAATLPAPMQFDVTTAASSAALLGAPTGPRTSQAGPSTGQQGPHAPQAGPYPGQYPPQHAASISPTPFVAEYPTTPPSAPKGRGVLIAVVASVVTAGIIAAVLALKFAGGASTSGSRNAAGMSSTANEGVAARSAQPDLPVTPLAAAAPLAPASPPDQTVPVAAIVPARGARATATTSRPSRVSTASATHVAAEPAPATAPAPAPAPAPRAATEPAPAPATEPAPVARVAHDPPPSQPTAAHVARDPAPAPAPAPAAPAAAPAQRRSGTLDSSEF